MLLTRQCIQHQWLAFFSFFLVDVVTPLLEELSPQWCCTCACIHPGVKTSVKRGTFYSIGSYPALSFWLAILIHSYFCMTDSLNKYINIEYQRRGKNIKEEIYPLFLELLHVCLVIQSNMFNKQYYQILSVGMNRSPVKFDINHPYLFEAGWLNPLKICMAWPTVRTWVTQEIVTSHRA